MFDKKEEKYLLVTLIYVVDSSTSKKQMLTRLISHEGERKGSCEKDDA